MWSPGWMLSGWILLFSSSLEWYLWPKSTSAGRKPVEVCDLA